MTGDSSAIIIDTSSGHKATELLVVDAPEMQVTRDSARIQKALEAHLDQQIADDDDDIFGDEDAPVLVKSSSESSEDKMDLRLADEIGVHEIVLAEEPDEAGAIKETIDFALLKPVFINKKDREVLTVNQETQL